jgi:hypothetical protein
MFSYMMSMRLNRFDFKMQCSAICAGLVLRLVNP